MNPPRLAATLASVAFAAASQASPPGTGTLTAQTSVNTNCSVSTLPVTFGAYDPIQANVTAPKNASGSVTIACVKGSAPAIGLGLGFYASGSTRRMRHATSLTAFLTYELFKPPTSVPGAVCTFPGANVWGNSGGSLFTPPAAPNKNARNFNVCGTVPGGQNVEVGTFSDTVVATVNF
jgi:spore coat protein U-like protein